MRFFTAIIVLLISVILSSCGSGIYDSELLERLDKRLPQYNAESAYRQNIPHYGNDDSLPLYKPSSDYLPSEKIYEAYDTKIYPIYDSEADNPVLPATRDIAPIYQYPTYDPSADNPYYNGQSYGGFEDKVYNDYYPIYDSSADNPVYPPQNVYQQQPYGGQRPKQYQYYNYNPEADNPVVPDNTKNLFNKPSFNEPLFDE
ncbi:MAG: hypothetical protein PQ612_08060 [Rickettsiales bacterium]|nr:hypothetical protein [Pseudomonadota bacterium]MDA0966824.1 hypothetical protein [Pseudomonadota bacterium]MDG4543498.1 hypothetical protein [Rickettsiales bacterium]MDG4546108.1 hypothetical protein [Rickettsiales bacterium]MDG4547581.1 hypothetical protein [Rickettsiales bacterium]